MLQILLANLHFCNFEQTIRARLSDSGHPRRTIEIAWRAPLQQSDSPRQANLAS
jgi:hypothetical protein